MKSLQKSFRGKGDTKIYVNKLSLFHYHFDLDFDLPSHDGFEGRVFVNNEIEVEAGI